MSSLDWQWAEHPFERIKITSLDEVAVKDFAEFVGYTGRIFEDDTDLFAGGTVFGFDIVKDRARKLHAELV